MESIKYDQQDVKGLQVKVSVINGILIFMTCLLAACLLFVTIHTSQKYTEIDDSARDYIELEKQADLVKDASDYLTEQVRLFVQNIDIKYVQLYFEEANVTKRREVALEHLKTYYLDDSGEQYLQAAVRDSQLLMKREIYAMKLVCTAMGYQEDMLPIEIQEMVLKEEDTLLEAQAMMEKARSMMFDTEYQYSKSVIYGNLEYFMQEVIYFTEGRLIGGLEDFSDAIFMQEVLIILIVIVITSICVVIAFFVIRPLNICLKCVKEESMIEVTGAYEFRRIAEVYNDIYRKKEASAANEAFLRYKAEHDPMTGLLNRSAFAQIKELLENDEIPLALLIIDVDKFKQVNDNYGHGVGDCILMRIAELLKEHFLAQDYLFRIGGDEFAAIITEVTEEQTYVIEERIQNINMELQHPVEGMPQVSLSVGAVFSAKGYDEELYKQADQALYWMKENGRCGCHFYGD